MKSNEDTRDESKLVPKIEELVEGTSKLDLLSAFSRQKTFEEWVNDFEIHREGEERVLEWLKEDNIDSLLLLLSTVIKSFLTEVNFTDRYILMTTFLVELLTTYKTNIEELSNLGEMIDCLAHAVYRLDVECGLERGLTKDLNDDDRKAIIKALDEDEKIFERILREEYMSFKYEECQLFFLEIGRCIHSFNGYQPPPRRTTETEEFKKDMKTPFFHYDDVLSRLEKFVIAEIEIRERKHEELRVVPLENGKDENGDFVGEK